MTLWNGFRELDEETTCPSPDAMHRQSEATHQLVEAVLSYSRVRMGYDPPPLDHPLSAPDLNRLAPDTITPNGMGGLRALSLFEDIIAPACLSSDHPRYLSFIPAAPTEAATAFDLVVSASSLYGGSWMEGAGAVHLENQVLSFLAREFGLPPDAGGVFVQGGTIGNLSALVAARQAARRARSEAGEPADPPRWLIACSEEAHSSLSTAAQVMDVDLLAIPVDAEGRMRGDALRHCLTSLPEQQRAGLFAIVATAGTTNFGIIDDLAGVAEVAATEHVWFHVDGAYGLAGRLVPQLRDRYDGLERADSAIVDPHKWLFAPFDACALIYRDPQQGLLAHRQHATYLDPLDKQDEWNPSDYAINLTRRPRGLPLWFSLATYGTDAYRRAIGSTVQLAHRIADEIDRRPELELVRRPELSVVVFRRSGWSLDQYEQWSQRLLDDQTAFVVPSSFHGEPVIRFAIINPSTTMEDLTMILDTLR